MSESIEPYARLPPCLRARMGTSTIFPAFSGSVWAVFMPTMVPPASVQESFIQKPSRRRRTVSA